MLTGDVIATRDGFHISALTRIFLRNPKLEGVRAECGKQKKAVLVTDQYSEEPAGVAGYRLQLTISVVK